MEWLSEMHDNYGDNCVIIIDDQALNITKDVAEIFTVGSSRRQCSVIYITQNLFGKKKECRDISLNSAYIVLFRNPRDLLTAQYLFRQIEPGRSKDLCEIYKGRN